MSTEVYHPQNVCKLHWKDDGFFFASENDNEVCIDADEVRICVRSSARALSDHARSIFRYFQNIKSISIEHSASRVRLTPRDFNVHMLSSFLDACPLENLVQIRLCRLRLEWEHYGSLVEAFNHLTKCQKLLKVSLWNVVAKDERPGLSALLNALAEVPTMKSLVIDNGDWCTQSQADCQAIEKLCTSVGIENLSFYGNVDPFKVSEPFFISSVNALRRPDSALVTLRMGCQGLSITGCKALSSALKDNKTLNELALYIVAVSEKEDLIEEIARGVGASSVSNFSLQEISCLKPKLTNSPRVRHALISMIQGNRRLEKVLFSGASIGNLKKEMNFYLEVNSILKKHNFFHEYPTVKKLVSILEDKKDDTRMCFHLLQMHPGVFDAVPCPPSARKRPRSILEAGWVPPTEGAAQLYHTFEPMTRQLATLVDLAPKEFKVEAVDMFNQFLSKANEAAMSSEKGESKRLKEC